MPKQDKDHSGNQKINYSRRYGSSNNFQQRNYDGHYETQSTYGEVLTDISSFLTNSTLARGEEMIDLNTILTDNKSRYFEDPLADTEIFYSTGPPQVKSETIDYQFGNNSPNLSHSSYNFSQSDNFFQKSHSSILTNNSPLHNPNSPLQSTSIQPITGPQDLPLIKNSPVYQPPSPAAFQQTLVNHTQPFVAEDVPLIKNSTIYQPPTAQFSSAQTSPTAYQQTLSNHQSNSPIFVIEDVSIKKNDPVYQPLLTAQCSPPQASPAAYQQISANHHQSKSPNFVTEYKSLDENSPAYQPLLPTQFPPAQTSPAAYQKTLANHQQSATIYQPLSTTQSKSPNFVAENVPSTKNSSVYQSSSTAQLSPTQTSPATYQQKSTNHQQSSLARRQQNVPVTNLQTQPSSSHSESKANTSGSKFLSATNNDMSLKMFMNPMPRMMEPEFWCSIKYYEFGKQVGEIFRAKWTNPTIRVDGGTDPQCKMRFCLGALSNPQRSEKSKKVRLHIGHGITFEHHVNGDIWLKCNPGYNVFIKSHYLDSCRNTVDAAHRMPESANDYLRIFDFEHCKRTWNNSLIAANKAVVTQSSAISGTKVDSANTPDDNSVISCDSMLKLCTLRVSFMKGWGPNYPNCSTIEDTPCWIEILLDKPAKILDEWLIGSKSRGRF